MDLSQQQLEISRILNCREIISDCKNNNQNGRLVTMDKNNSISALQAAALVKGDLEAEIVPIAVKIAEELDRLGVDDPLASWTLISKHFILKGSQDYGGIWASGDDIFDLGFKDKPLSEMLTILAQSNYGGPNFALKLARDGRIFVNSEAD